MTSSCLCICVCVCMKYISWYFDMIWLCFVLFGSHYHTLGIDMINLPIFFRVASQVQTFRFLCICVRMQSRNGLNFGIADVSWPPSEGFWFWSCFVDFPRFDLVKLVKFEVSGNFLENAMKEWPVILHVDVFWPPSELIRFWPWACQILCFQAFSWIHMVWMASILAYYCILTTFRIEAVFY